jgi:mRNA-degrading endonuclease RelE of RelBE toxin-antitoxin system
VTIFREINYLPQFEKDLKKLSKKFGSLPNDLEIFIQTQLNLYHKLQTDNGGIFRIPGLPFSTPPIFKAKKFACRALKGRGSKSGIRVVYAFHEKEDRIDLIEIYFKDDKENEDRARVNALYKIKQ